jgi:TatD DNase family protein
MDLFDTHCHIQSIAADSKDFTAKKWRDAGIEKPAKVIEDARKAGVNKLMLVGTDMDDSRLALDLASKHDGCWASVGIHPHEAAQFFQAVKACQSAGQPTPPSLSAHRGVDDSSAPSQYNLYSSVHASSSPSAVAEPERINPFKKIEKLLKERKVVAIGEVGLDYYYEHSAKKEQIKLLEFWLDKACSTKLPVIFHVRDAYKDFWPIFDNFKNLEGVLHSFSATTKELEQALERNLYIGLNGIMTFTSDEKQLEAAKRVPLNRLLLETDAPYLTPKPFRGKICKPEHVAVTAHFLAELRQEAVEQIASATTANASELFNIA